MNRIQLPPISVIVPTRNRADDLAKSLPAVLALDYPVFEVIVVDQSTDDSTARAVSGSIRQAQNDGRRWELLTLVDGETAAGELREGSFRLVHCRSATVGVSLSLNLGVRLAKGDIMAFTPDDCTVPAGWLRTGSETLARDPGAGMLFGAVVAADHDWRRTFVPWFVPPAYVRLQGWSARLRFRGAMGANMFIRREVFERAGMFDECLGTGCQFHSAEDLDLGYRALKTGLAVILDPENKVTHWGERDYSDDTGRRLIRNTRYGNGAFFIKHVRCGDPLAAWGLLGSLTTEARGFLVNLVTRRRAEGAGRFLYLLRGALAGLRQPIDRVGQVYLPSNQPAMGPRPEAQEALG